MAMQKGENTNRPAKGSVIIVDPIKDLEVVKMVRDHLRPNIQQWCIYVVGTNTNLRAVDLANIEAKDVAYISKGQVLKIREQKTKKYREVVFNKSCISAIRKLLKERGNEEGHLFQNRDGGQISTQYINQFMKRACKEVGLQGNYGSHTLRKTWGYHQYRQYNAKITDLVWCFNHKTEQQTMDYLGLSIEEMGKLFMNEI